MKVYIAGCITSISREQAEHNFKQGEVLIRSCGNIPVNPLDYTTKEMDHRQAMKLLVPFMLDCDAILMLMEWEFSEGAKIEFALAHYAGLTILMEEDYN